MRLSAKLCAKPCAMPRAMPRAILCAILLALPAHAAGVGLAPLAPFLAERPSVTTRTVLVSTPASLTEAFTEMARVFEAKNPGVKVDLNLGGSNALARQIEQGAPADVFASADAQTMDRLERKKLLEPGTRKGFARNVLVLAVPEHGVGSLSWKDLPAHPGIKRIAVGDEGVPVGVYSRQVLEKLGIMAAVKPKLVMGADVRQVLAYLAQGEVDAGIVYETDALASHGRVRPVDRAPAGSHDPIAYPIAVLAASHDKPAARRFVTLVAGSTGQSILKKRGFLEVRP